MHARGWSSGCRLLAVAAAALLTVQAARAATKTVDLDGRTGAESQCDLNVLSTFPVKIEVKVTNKTPGDAFTFSWKSAGPSGFTSSVAAGTPGGVGVKWVYTTNQTLFSYTGNSCAKDICFNKTAGPDPVTARGPFGVPGRSLFTTDVTVSSASLTSSLITFFSPPKEIFKVTSTAQPGGVLVTQQNATGNAVTVSQDAYPPGCCQDAHRLNCGGVCVEYLSDPNNCGACGNVCGAGTCCANGNCVAECPAGYTFCPAAGLCFDLRNDPDNCGACGNVCPVDNVCTGGACIPCDGQAGKKNECDNRCTNLNTDPFNCGACGTSCNLSCPSGFQGVCSNGQSCRCEAGPPSPRPPSNDPVGVVPGCPNPPPPPPAVVEAPVCEIPASSETIPPGGASTTCLPAGVLYKEALTTVTICGDTIPGPAGSCGGVSPHESTGTVMRLLPDTSKTVGNAYITPYAVHVVSDTSGDSMLGVGETGSLIIEVLNAGPMPVTSASAQLLSPAVDLTDDGVNNPIAVTIGGGSASYGTIQGTSIAGPCSTGGLQPASNAVPFQVTIPAGHPGDTSRPFTLQVAGMVNGAPYSMSVPIGLGIADKCDAAAATGDYDGLDGLLSPMAKLVPTGDTVPFPPKALTAGKSAPLKVRILCGGVNLRGGEVDAPEIVGLSERTRGAIDITKLNLNNDTNSNDPFFRFSTSAKQYIYNMRTAELGTGTFTLTIRIAGRKDYVTGFVLQ